MNCSTNGNGKHRFHTILSLINSLVKCSYCCLGSGSDFQVLVKCPNFFCVMTKLCQTLPWVYYLSLLNSHYDHS